MQWMEGYPMLLPFCCLKKVTNSRTGDRSFESLFERSLFIGTTHMTPELLAKVFFDMVLGIRDIQACTSQRAVVVPLDGAC